MIDLSALDPAQVSSRIKAARELRGISQAELGKRFDEDGLNKSDPGRLERMDESVPFRRAHLDALCRHLRVPERWFIAENVDEIVGYETRDDLLQKLLASIDRVFDRLPANRPTTEEPDAAAGPSPGALRTELESESPKASDQDQRSRPTGTARSHGAP